MKKRNLIFVLALTYFTLFIYHIYWLYSIRKDVVKKYSKADIPPVIVLVLPFILIFAGLIAVGLSLPTEAETNLAVAVALSTIIIGLGIACWWYYKFIYSLHMAIGGTDPSPVYIICLLTLFFGVGPIWTLITQSDINKSIKR